MKSVKFSYNIDDMVDNYVRLENQVPLVVAKEWDYLIVLDGCRYDTFKEINDIPGKLRPVWSPAPRTKPWMDVIFAEHLGTWKDVVVVSGSQFTDVFRSKFKKHRNCLLKDWDEEEGTISGKNVTQAALHELVGFPKDKMIIWYMQPHVPFIGEKRIGHDTMKLGKKKLLTIEVMVRHSGHSPEYIYEAYKDNLRYVLFHVKELLKHLHGRVIITSDHGNGFGENKYWGHENDRTNTKYLREVPWLEINLDEKVLEKQKLLIENSDWKYLIILDDCRYDVFESVDIGIEGELTPVISPASESREWIDAVLAHNDYSDTIIVTGNPHFASLRKVLNFEYIRDSFLYDWTEIPGTTDPKLLTDSALRLTKMKPECRMILWYMQPHGPFIKLNDKLKPHTQRTGWGRTQKGCSYFINALRNGLITKEEVIEMFVDNLKWALPHIQRFIEETSGKTIITSDHGEMLGEREGVFGHPTNFDHPAIKTVPWFVVRR